MPNLQHKRMLLSARRRREHFDTRRHCLSFGEFLMPTHYLACDLGADSGRLMLGTLDGGKISLEEMHRFPTGATKVAGALHWEFDRLLNELKTGLRKAAAKNLPIASISTDSWGVDYVLYDERGLPMPPVWCYRDSRTAQGVEDREGKSRVADNLCRDRHPVHGAQHDLPDRHRTAGTARPGETRFCSSATRLIFSAPASRATKFPSPAPRSFTTRPTNAGPKNCSPRSACAKICSRRFVRPAPGSAR